MDLAHGFEYPAGVERGARTRYPSDFRGVTREVQAWVACGDWAEQPHTHLNEASAAPAAMAGLGLFPRISAIVLLRWRVHFGPGAAVGLTAV